MDTDSKETEILVALDKDTSKVASDNNGDNKETRIVVADDKATIDLASVNIGENESVEDNNNRKSGVIDIKEMQSVGADSKEEVSLVDNDNEENRIMVAKKRKMDTLRNKLTEVSIGTFQWRKRLHWEVQHPTNNPWILKRALVERTTLANDMMDPKDKGYKGLLEEMKLEKTKGFWN